MGLFAFLERAAGRPARQALQQALISVSRLKGSRGEHKVGRG